MASQRGINIEALERANNRFGRFIAAYSQKETSDPEYDVFLAAVIKGFEFTYGQAINAVQRYVSQHVLPPGQGGNTLLPDIIRYASKSGLIGPPEQWFDFWDWRNETAHEYFNDESAGRIASVAPKFHEAVSQLIDELRARTP